MFPGVRAAVCSEADGSSPAGLVGEDRVLAETPSHGVAAVQFDLEYLVLYFRWKRQMPE